VGSGGGDTTGRACRAVSALAPGGDRRLAREDRSFGTGKLAGPNFTPLSHVRAGLARADVRVVDVARAAGKAYGFAPNLRRGRVAAPTKLRAVIAEPVGQPEHEVFDPKANMPPVGAR
jgi:hypothetical protein